MSKRNKGRKNYITGQRIVRKQEGTTIVNPQGENVQPEEDEVLVDVASQIGTAQDWVEKNKNIILIILAAITLAIVGWFLYKNYVQKPGIAKAAEKMQYAQNYFDQKKYELALEGDTLHTDAGFFDIIDNYSGTPSANLAKYYAGISYLNLGNFDMAVSYLKDYSNTGSVLDSYKYGALADAYSELNQNDKALSNYKKATTTQVNEAATPYHLWKLGLFQEAQGNAGAAKTAFETITKKYPNSMQASDAKKYLARVK